MKKLSIIIAFTLGLSVLLLPLNAQKKHNNKVIAHRGAWKNTGAPQNSIASLKNAIKLGCVGSEFDVRMTKDSVLVINHDPHFEGMDIEKTTYANLLKYPLKNGEPIPTLEQYLNAGKRQKKTLLITEIKPSPSGKERSLLLTQKVVETVKRLKVQKKVVYISFDYDILKKIIELDTTAKTQYLNGGISPEQLKKDQIGGADYHFSIYQKDENFLPQAQKLGVITNAWTVNEDLVMDYLLSKHIDFITTDEPEKALIKVNLLKKINKK